ncbi:hypothetical protein ACIBKY_52630 [Nonomuraea sp. NPDC050394]|uniref:hypothetical protein n=1 Tax=Nonomuraea sp. NPDC050394 TaxID=3364363 RepID=UPI0037A0CC65
MALPAAAVALEVVTDRSAVTALGRAGSRRGRTRAGAAATGLGLYLAAVADYR